MGRSAERREFLADVVTTAVEGGTGYWAQVSEYRWVDEPARAVLHELDDDESGYRAEGLLLDQDAVAKGIGRIARGEVELGATLKELILRASRENDAADIDAEAADVIAQVALLGEIRYG